MKQVPMLPERRAFDRKLPHDLRISHRHGAGRLRLVDISLGGFSLSSPRPFVLGLQQVFEFTTGGESVFALQAMAVHARRVEQDGGVAYQTGFAFVAPTEKTRDTIALIVHGLASGVLANWPSVVSAETPV